MKRVRTNETAERLLLRAESEFIADPQRRSLEYWYEQILVKAVPVDTVRRYALENHWSERRQSFWRGVQAAWLKQRHTQLLQQRSTELHQATDLRAKAYDLIRPKIGPDGVERFPIQPKSWEGAVRAFVSLDDMVETKREAIMSQLEPMLAAAEEVREEGPAELPFSREEMRDIAHGLLRQRRKRRRLEMGLADEDEEDDEGDESENEGVGEPLGDVARPPGG